MQQENRIGLGAVTEQQNINALGGQGQASTSKTLEKCYLGVLSGLKELSVGQRVILIDEINKTLGEV